MFAQGAPDATKNKYIRYFERHDLGSGLFLQRADVLDYVFPLRLSSYVQLFGQMDSAT